MSSDAKLLYPGELLAELVDRIKTVHDGQTIRFDGSPDQAANLLDRGQGKTLVSVSYFTDVGSGPQRQNGKFSLATLAVRISILTAFEGRKGMTEYPDSMQSIDEIDQRIQGLFNECICGCQICWQQSSATVGTVDMVGRDIFVTIERTNCYC